MDFYSGYGGFFCSSFEVTADEFGNLTEARSRGLPLPGRQSYEDRNEELVEAARFKQMEINYAERKIVDEQRKMDTLAVRRSGRRGSGSGSGGGRGDSGKAGRVGGLARDPEAGASGSASSSHSGGGRPGGK